TRFSRDWSSDVCSSDLPAREPAPDKEPQGRRLPAGSLELLGQLVVVEHLPGTCEPADGGPESNDQGQRGDNGEDPRVRHRPVIQIGRAACRGRRQEGGG